jgi:uncharacterized Zn-finger protein
MTCLGKRGTQRHRACMPGRVLAWLWVSRAALSVVSGKADTCLVDGCAWRLGSTSTCSKTSRENQHRAVYIEIDGDSTSTCSKTSRENQHHAVYIGIDGDSTDPGRSTCFGQLNCATFISVERVHGTFELARERAHLKP